MAHPYKKHREALLAVDPHCNHCGVEHSTEEPLHYHHTIPQYTGATDHSRGVLLCARCHQDVHGNDRRTHKVIDPRTGEMATQDAYAHKRQRRAERRRAEKMLDAFAHPHYRGCW